MESTIFCCPICRERLAIEASRAICQRGHSFDKAREGYYNLLHTAKGGAHGDNREMVMARREFLSLGHYDFLARRIGELMAEYAEDGGAVLDCGAGEGYYTERVREALLAAGKKNTVYGFDISKDAVRYAAKRYPELRMAVASAYHIPVHTGIAHALLCAFSPVCAEEFRRVLCDGGIFVMAIPEREHLFGLKAAIYDTPYKNEVASYELEGFSLLFTEELRKTVTLSGDEIRPLFAMTPYAYRTAREGRERVLALSELETDFHFRLFVYRRDCDKKP